MTELKKAQLKFTQMVAQLITFAYSLPGWALAFGDAYRDERVPYGEKTSLHRSRLAVDMLLHVNGEYIDCASPDPAELAREIRYYTVLGEFWESIGGTWGGRFVGKNAGDYNHFSLSYGGYK